MKDGSVVSHGKAKQSIEGTERDPKSSKMLGMKRHVSLRFRGVS